MSQILLTQYKALESSLNSIHPKLSSKRLDRLFYECATVNFQDNGKWICRNQNALISEIKNIHNLIEAGSTILVSEMIDQLWLDQSKKGIFDSLISNLFSAKEKKALQKDIEKKVKTLIPRNQRSSNAKGLTEATEKALYAEMLKGTIEKLMQTSSDISEHARGISGKYPFTYLAACDIIIESKQSQEWKKEYGISLLELSELLKDLKAEELFDSIMREKIKILTQEIENYEDK